MLNLTDYMFELSSSWLLPFGENKTINDFISQTYIFTLLGNYMSKLNKKGSDKHYQCDSVSHNGNPQFSQPYIGKQNITKVYVQDEE